MDRRDDLNAIEARLGSWRPAPLAIDRDRMLFLAGRASAARELRRRVAIGVCLGFAVLACVAVGPWAHERDQRIRLESLLAAQLHQAQPVAVETTVTPPPPPPPPSSYLMLSHGDGAIEPSGSPTIAQVLPDPSPVGHKRTLSPMSLRMAGNFEF